MVADVSAAIATGQPLGRADLEIWRRRLTEAARQSRAEEADATLARVAVDQLCSGIDRQVIDLAGLAGVARRQLGAGAAA